MWNNIVAEELVSSENIAIFLMAGIGSYTFWYYFCQWYHQPFLNQLSNNLKLLKKGSLERY